MPAERSAAAERAPCLVPFCGRTTARARLSARGDAVWICGPHWSAVPRRMCAVYRRARAAERRAAAADRIAFERLMVVPDWWSLPESDPVVDGRLRAAWDHVRATRRCRRLWSACRRRAIDAAGGIG